LHDGVKSGKMDKYSQEKRSEVMRSVKSKDTDIELQLRRALWAKGLRYQKNYRGVRGKPDIAFPFLKIAVFCDSEFWHGYDWENRKNDFKSNREFWFRKIERNIERDKEITSQLQEKGWTVIRFWGREIHSNLESCVAAVYQCVQDKKVLKKARKSYDTD